MSNQGLDQRAERVVVVSLMKSGTHLIQELIVALGYGVVGQSRITEDIKPKLDDEVGDRIRLLVAEKSRVDGVDPKQAWESLSWAWQHRLGARLGSLYGMEFLVNQDVEHVAHRTARSRFADTPPNTCWILPRLRLPDVDGAFLNEWRDTGEPRIILMYRDPRDVLVSMINFLQGKTAVGFGRFSNFAVYSKILQSLPDISTRVGYALADPDFPGAGDFLTSLWLLRHPDVCAVSFEELVGARGGGSEDLQQTAIRRVIRFLGCSNADTVPGDRLFNTGSFSFYKGQIGNWRKELSPELQEFVTQHFARELAEYGYSDSATLSVGQVSR